MILGLDVSTTCVGIAIVDESENIVISEAVKLSSKDSLEKRAFQIQQRIADLADQYNIERVFVEQPIILFKGGGAAKSTAVLQRFNGMICFAVFSLFGFEPTMVNAVSARNKLGIKIVKKRGSKKNDRKQPIIDFICEKYKNTPTPFTYNLTPKGNFQPTTDDRADSIVVALAGPLLNKKS
jgi:hypothetical protein